MGHPCRMQRWRWPKGRDAVIARTHSLGVYRGSLGKDVDANDVVISCEKAGFKQVRLFRRTEQDARAETPMKSNAH